MRRQHRQKVYLIIGFVTILLFCFITNAVLNLSANVTFFKIGPVRAAHRVGRSQLSEDFIEEEAETDSNHNKDSMRLKQLLREFGSRAYFDTRGIYKILPHVQVASRWDLNTRPLCVAVQSSLDNAHMIVEQATNWPGIISFALFAAGSENYLAISYIKYLKFCFPLIAERYPQNLLRNVARDHCQNEWITCPDIDMVFPSPDNDEHEIVESLEEFLESSNATSCQKCAFVLPTYEIKMDIRPVPRNKTELLQFLSESKVRQFHIETYPEGQEMSDLKFWEKLDSNDLEVNIAYAAKPFEWQYEPIFIARRGTPRFDERYVGYGTVRVEQALEMFLEGYKYWILDNVFLVHRGFKKKGYISRTRNKQMRINWWEFCENHLRELVVKYDADPLGLLKKFGRLQDKKKIQVTVRNSTTVPNV